jgi:hypothetical protein
MDLLQLTTEATLKHGNMIDKRDVSCMDTCTGLTCEVLLAKLLHIVVQSGGNSDHSGWLCQVVHDPALVHEHEAPKRSGPHSKIRFLDQITFRSTFEN